jgi:CMP/dCMP kinase
MKLNEPFVITISRQLGSGGAYIGKQLAKKLNIFYADREIISQVAKKLLVLEEDIENRDEKVSSFWQTFFQFYAASSPDLLIPPPTQIIPSTKALMKAETEVITHIAQERSAVIIGRCGCNILKDHPNHLSLYFYADMDFRKERVQKKYNLTPEAAENMIIQSDKDRAFYHQTFAGKEWRDANQYALSMNAGKIGLDACVELIMQYLK